MPGEQQQPGNADELIGAQVVAVLAHQHSEDVLARLRSRTADQGGHVLAVLAARRDPHFLGQRSVQHSSRTALECGAVGVWDAQQLADRQRRHREREPGHQVGQLTSALQIIQRRLDDLHDPWLQRTHSPYREFGCDHSA